MNEQTGGALLVIAGALAVIMAVRGSWNEVWAALTNKPSSKHASNAASFDLGPGGVQSAGTGGAIGGGSSGGGLPGGAPGPLAPRPGTGGSYDALVRGSGLHFAGVDQGIDFTGPGQILAPVAAIVRRVQRSGSGWPGEGAFELLQLNTGRYMYVAEDFSPTVQTGAHVPAGSVIGIASGSGRAPGIELGFADAAGHPLSPLYPGPHDPKPWGYQFQQWIQGLGRGSVQGSGLLA